MKRMVFTIMALGLAIILATPALAEYGTTQGEAVAPSAAVALRVPVSFSFSNARHVANSVALRNRCSGTIHLRGVPVTRTVIAAYLYWNYNDVTTSGPATAVAFFNGNRVVGVKVADNLDPCWSPDTANHTYRASVMPFVPATRPNEDYVVNIPNCSTSTSGQNPWSPSESTAAAIPRQEGATLVVVYRSDGGKVAIYDRLNGAAMLGADGTFILIHPAIGLSGAGLFTMAGADGQLGSGYPISTAAGEKTFFNGAQIAGPGAPAGQNPNSDWDGSDGLPIPQLYDTHTHVVTLTSTLSTVLYDVGSDCMVPVVFVLQQGSTP